MARRGLLLLVCFSALTVAGAGAPGIGQASEVENPQRCLSGRVVSADSARGIDAMVRLDGFDSSSTCRTVSGVFTCCGVSGEARYDLEASAPGYESARLSVQPDVDQPNGITVVLRSTLPRELPRAAGLNSSVSVETLKVPPRARAQLVSFFRAAQKQDWQKALALLRKAVEIYPDYVDAWINMGVVYAQLNEARMAETAFRKAADLRPDDPVIHRKLGYLFLAVGEWDKALAELNIAKSLDPSDGRTELYLQQARDHRKP